MINPTLVVMAAGMGSRYGGLKQIDPVGPTGELVIDYSIYDAIRSGFKKVVFIIRKDIEQAFRESIGNRIEKQIEVDYVFQELTKLPAGLVAPASRTKPWGTGHAVLMARDKIKEPFGVINADDFYGLNSYQVLAEFLKQSSSDKIPEYVIVAFQLNKTLSEFGSVTRGVCQTDEKGYLTQIKERFKISKNEKGEITDIEPNGTIFPLKGNEPVSMNMWGFNPSVFAFIEELFISFLKSNLNEAKAEYFLPTLIGELVKQNRVKVKTVSTQEEWFGVTYPEDKSVVVQRIQNLINQKRYPSNLWNK
jgi:NDP-sugar pyrophosphorylase family protein